jgi:hypothetical protein
MWLGQADRLGREDPRNTSLKLQEEQRLCVGQFREKMEDGELASLGLIFTLISEMMDIVNWC